MRFANLEIDGMLRKKMLSDFFKQVHSSVLKNSEALNINALPTGIYFA